MADTTTCRPLIAAGTLLGIGMGGFVDGIVFHQLLQVHNMLSAQYPTTGLDAERLVVNLEINMFWDGLFHVFTWVMTALGLALLALTRKLEAAPADSDRERAAALARQITTLQHPDGSFESYLRIRGDEPHGSVSLYYPGEAMLGLARLDALGLDPDGAFMAAAHRGADFLIASRAGRDRLPPDAWLMQALDALYEDRPDPRYAEHALAIARSMLADQRG